MKKTLKRIQLIYRTHNGKYKKFWQYIDCNQMIILEHIWNNIKQKFILSSLDTKYKFYNYKTKQLLPSWYHVDLLNDNDQILIDEFIESTSSNKSPNVSTLIKNECIKNISKKKQLKTFITNRSFIITNKYSIPNEFYQQWDEGKMHKNTKNCRIIF